MRSRDRDSGADGVHHSTYNRHRVRRGGEGAPGTLRAPPRHQQEHRRECHELLCLHGLHSRHVHWGICGRPGDDRKSILRPGEPGRFVLQAGPHVPLVRPARRRARAARAHRVHLRSLPAERRDEGRHPGGDDARRRYHVPPGRFVGVFAKAWDPHHYRPAAGRPHRGASHRLQGPLPRHEGGGSCRGCRGGGTGGGRGDPAGPRPELVLEGREPWPLLGSAREAVRPTFKRPYPRRARAGSLRTHAEFLLNRCLPCLNSPL
mmetsp:Transcript_79691/g.207839  ORF Transcript_79691/g.207839 Transcript_79691/m.207839 type:complete len:262 (+) Transcript_79691:154-939(+)